ncbi:hypothetical protein GCM10010260_16520 [Streptomyces filipinensis]|uniref:Lipoprotein n=1 Tax=Streptomyces filipinensis TaxID=66887 RepID=A0A918I7F6_9ACTN|nr:hypothetical protein [Streptomyces filipinensis]GGU84247.1 hypothetical protein GCM10010260_16520 [Streptomyces filipinensis]
MARAVRQTEAADSLRYSITGRAPEQGRIRAEGWVGTRPAVGRVRITTLGGAEPGTLELRLVGRHLYSSMSAAGVRESHGRHWLDFGPTAKFRSGGGLRVDMTAMRDEAGHNPVREAAFLTAAKDIHRTGTETVEQTRTTHYTGTVTVAELRRRLRDQDGPGRAGRRRSLDVYAEQGVDELTLDVWLDGRNQVSRQRVRGFGRHGEFDLTVTFHDVGAPVRVRAPATADTVDVRKPAHRPER